MKKPDILDLCPTQFVLGMKEIEFKVEKINKFSDRELKEYCDDHVIPVVIGPRKQPFLVDHHHFARACWETGVDVYSTKVIKDLSHLDVKEFWNAMIKNHWTYLHDQFGMGPHTPLALPSDIRCMADDPYRSLAWALVNNGSIKKIDVLFYEFQWAAFFRQNLEVTLHSKSDFKDAIRAASQLAKSKEAAHIPGFKKR
ncbi:MAG: ParB-like protein [Pseudobdellovibrio sp.]